MEAVAVSSGRRKECSAEEDGGLRKGPWTVDEDLRLIRCISSRGEGRWNTIAKSAGLRRTGKSCRLRWLNYLRPDLKRGNITPEEQILILDLHTRFGNQWSKIARHLPGRTDNEIKNYWRTRIQKHIDKVGGNVEFLRYSWIQRFMLFRNSSNNKNCHSSDSNITSQLCCNSETDPKPCSATSTCSSSSCATNSEDQKTALQIPNDGHPPTIPEAGITDKGTQTVDTLDLQKKSNEEEDDLLDASSATFQVMAEETENGWWSDWNTGFGWDLETQQHQHETLLWQHDDCFL